MRNVDLIFLPFIPDKFVTAKTKKISIDEEELDRCIEYITTECTFSSTLNNILDGIELKAGDSVIYKDCEFVIHSVSSDLIDGSKEYVFQKVE